MSEYDMKKHYSIFSARQDNKGFTLIELLVAMAVGIIALAAFYGVFTVQNKRFSIEEQIIEIQQNARAAMDILTREIRMAGFNPDADATSQIITATADTFSFRTDEPGDDSTITYSFDLADHQITRNINEGGDQPLAENIESLAFTYYDGSGSTTATASAIRQIRIAITARTARPDPLWPNNGGYRTYTITSDVTPRNLLYQ